VTRWVLDASAAIRLFVPDGPLPAQVEDAIDAAARGDDTLLAPELLPAEVAQVLLKKERAGLLEPSEAAQVQQAIDELPVVLVSHRELLPGANRLARAHGLTIYDALYLALAKGRHAHLLTADERLGAALR